MLYTITIRQSSVTFNLLIWANSKRSATRKAGRQIKANYQGFRITHIA